MTVPVGWNHPGYDAEDSFYNPSESVINASSVGHLARKWSVPLRQRGGACVRGPAAPLVAGGRVFVADRQGISAYQAVDGRVVWRFDWLDPDDATTPSMAVSGDVLIAANSGCQSQSDPNGAIVGLDVASGRARWQADVEAPVESLVVDRGVAVVSGSSPSDAQATIAYRAADGGRVWSRAGYAASGVSADGRLLLTGSASSSAVAVTTGKTLWTKPHLWYAESASPAGDRFYVTDGTALTSVNAASGRVEWAAAGKVGPLTATDGRRIYHAAVNTIEALDARTGRPVWARQLTRPVGQPVRAGGLLYTGGPVLIAATGAIVASGTALSGSQVVASGSIYMVSDARLMALAP